MAQKMPKDISKALDAYLLGMYCLEKKTLAQIAEEFGCTPATVLHHLRKCGIEPRKRNDYETSEAVREAWRRLGRATKGRRLSESQKAAISKRNKGRRKRNDYEFGGHEKKRSDGYIKVYVPEHPRCTADGYVMKHILVMERSLGRYLRPGEVVHHENHVRDDNRIENLRLMTVSEHMSMHMRERHRNGGKKNVT